MTDVIARYPLQWPAGWRRSRSTSRAAFRAARRSLSVSEGVQRVLHELNVMGVSQNDVVVSTNVRTRLDGTPRSDQAEPHDSGVAVYWRRGKETRCMAIDRYDRVADNLAAIAATLDAMRAIERHGGGAILDRVFQGFTALPAPESWWQVLGLKDPDATREQIETAHRVLIMKHHPDRPDGDTEKAARINRARDQGLAACS